MTPWKRWSRPEHGLLPVMELDRKSTRLNSSHRCISYAVFCLKKKITKSDEDPVVRGVERNRAVRGDEDLEGHESSAAHLVRHRWLRIAFAPTGRVRPAYGDRH